MIMIPFEGDFLQNHGLLTSGLKRYKIEKNTIKIKSCPVRQESFLEPTLFSRESGLRCRPHAPEKGTRKAPCDDTHLLEGFRGFIPTAGRDFFVCAATPVIHGYPLSRNRKKRP
jgi:hypothetical protein